MSKLKEKREEKLVKSNENKTENKKGNEDSLLTRQIQFRWPFWCEIKGFFGWTLWKIHKIIDLYVVYVCLSFSVLFRPVETLPQKRRNIFVFSLFFNNALKSHQKKCY